MDQLTQFTNLSIDDMIKNGLSSDQINTLLFDKLNNEDDKPEFTEDYFNKLDNILKKGCLIMIPQKELLNYTLFKYVGEVINMYDEHAEIQPYVDTTLEELEKDFCNYTDCFQDIHEFCSKIYGGYIEGDKVMTTVNFNGEWSYCKYVNLYNIDTLDFDNFQIKIRSYIDFDKKIIRKNSKISESEWCEEIKTKFTESSDNGKLYFVYAEYF